MAIHLSKFTLKSRICKCNKFPVHAGTLTGVLINIPAEFCFDDHLISKRRDAFAKYPLTLERAVCLCRIEQGDAIVERRSNDFDHFRPGGNGRLVGATHILHTQANIGNFQLPAKFTAAGGQELLEHWFPVSVTYLLNLKPVKLHQPGQSQILEGCGDSSFLIWLVFLAGIHLNRPEQMRERERTHPPFSVFFNIYFRHHKRICYFPAADLGYQVDVI